MKARAELRWIGAMSAWVRLPWLFCASAVLIVLILTQSACGGGGNDSSDDEGVTHAQFVGRLWFDKFVKPARGGKKQFLDLNSPGAGTLDYIVPSPDGTRFVLFGGETGDAWNDSIRSLFEVYDTESLESMLTMDTDWYIGGFKFSADAHYLAVIVRPDYFSDKNIVIAIVDLKPTHGRPKIVRTLDGEGKNQIVRMEWIPGGQKLLTVRADGRLLATDMNASEDQIEKIGELPRQLDQYVTAADISISPDGKKMAGTMYRDSDTGSKTDVWISNIDGTQIEQFSDEGFSGSPQWSPDGKFLSVVVSTGLMASVSTSGSVWVHPGSKCHQWFAPSTARKIPFGTANAPESRMPELSCYGGYWTR